MTIEFKIFDSQKDNEDSAFPSAGYKFYSFICMLYLTLDLLSYIYVYYIVNVENFILSFSAVFFTTTYVITDIVVEVYGYRYARRLIWFGLMCEACFSLLIFVIGNIHFQTVKDNHINILLSNNILRIFISSLLTTPIGDFINSIAISRWRIYLKGKYFILRSICSTALGLIVYCILSHTTLFYGVLSAKELFTLIGTTLLFKISFVSICAIPASYIMRLLKRIEKLDRYDYGVNYNPFKFN